ncbi:hypothetical protein [Stutzerimonas stutzeri]|uniref:hypothetical protein n=1 Tax=Stutzerimonas stutzeri TaxID=316 RepID=UPI0021086BEB|nr:hypothetical protein [Stutzerimonas stutzeri]MCQ4318863.1 hypothetical protein [Stutzerimonas stutzeri]
MSSKTLETLVKRSDLNPNHPLELWKQLRRCKTDNRPSAAALARRASMDLEFCAAGR